MIIKAKYYFEVIKYEIIMLPQLLRYLFSFKKKVLYVGCTGMGNLGDEVVYEATKSLLNQKFIFYKILYSKPNAGKIARKIFVKSPSYIFLGGGTIIKKGIDSGYLKLFVKLHNEYPKAKLIVFGAGVADPILAKEIGFPTDIASWSTILNKCEFIAVRGVFSKSLLETKEWSVHNEVNILHDPALFFAKKNLILKTKTKTIGINFCDILGRIYGGDAKKTEDFANELIRSLLDDHWNIILYPTTVSDLAYMLKIIDKKLLARLEFYEYSSAIKSSLEFFDTIDVFLGQRLHSVIFSSITYTPFHGIEYESKISDYLLTLGLDDYSTRTDSLNLNHVLHKINYLYHNLHDEQKKLFTLCQKARQEQIACTQKLIN